MENENLVSSKAISMGKLTTLQCRLHDLQWYLPRQPTDNKHNCIFGGLLSHKAMSRICLFIIYFICLFCSFFHLYFLSPTDCLYIYSIFWIHVFEETSVSLWLHLFLVGFEGLFDLSYFNLIVFVLSLLFIILP